jgi:hypothetical protein
LQILTINNQEMAQQANLNNVQQAWMQVTMTQSLDSHCQELILMITQQQKHQIECHNKTHQLAKLPGDSDNFWTHARSMQMEWAHKGPYIPQMKAN